MWSGEKSRKTLGEAEKRQVDLEDPHNIAQIIQGAMFILLAMCLSHDLMDFVQHILEAYYHHHGC